MALRRIAKMGAALLVAGALAIGAAPPASAHKSSSSGNRSLAAVLAKDGSRFDRNWNDYDIVDHGGEGGAHGQADQPGRSVLADGKTRVTAFLPDDRAFHLLVKDITGSWVARREEGVHHRRLPRHRHRRGGAALPRGAGRDHHLQDGAQSNGAS